MGKPIGFAVTTLAPVEDILWHFSPEARRAYWRALAPIVKRVKLESLRRGVDKNGSRLTPISERTRKARRHPDYSPMGRAHPNNHPLQATGELSRTLTLFETAATPDGVVCYWKFDRHIQAYWGKILRYHALGQVRGAPVRDLFGISASEQYKIMRAGRAWWAANRARFVLSLSFEMPKPLPIEEVPLVVKMPAIEKPTPPRKPKRPVSALPTFDMTPVKISQPTYLTPKRSRSTDLWSSGPYQLARPKK